MDIQFDLKKSAGYKSLSQIARVLTEDWGKKNLYCVSCPQSHLDPLKDNSRVYDYACGKCKELYQLKSQRKPLGDRFVDSAYEPMIGQFVTEKIAVIKENIVVRRFARFERQGDGIVAAYIHPPAAKVGVLVELAGEAADAATLQALAKDVAMHAAAASPAAALFVSKDEVPAHVLEKEKEIYRAQAGASGKPAPVVEKIVDGKIDKFYATSACWNSRSSRIRNGPSDNW